MFHTDELPAYGVTEEEVSKVRQALHAAKDDCVLLVADKRDRAEDALKAAIDRAREAISGVPEETRAAQPDGTTRYSRPRPGSARMYPETDIVAVPVAPEKIVQIRGSLPEKPEKKFERFVKQYKLSNELAEAMIRSYHLDLFETIVTRMRNVPPAIVAATLEHTWRNLKREGIPVENVGDEKVEEVFRELNAGKVAKEAIPDVLAFLSRNEGSTVSQAMEKLGIKGISTEELNRVVDEILKKNMELIREKKMEALSALMGDVMKQLRGKVDGKTVNESLRKKLEEKTKST
jgi:glutamyl-tRNA(Gln) amidotransferase subunit E